MVVCMAQSSMFEDGNDAFQQRDPAPKREKNDWALQM